MYESGFFSGTRRRLTLADYRQLKTKAGERKKKLLVIGEISPNGSLVAMPPWISEPYLLLQKDDLSADRVNLGKEVELKQMTVEIYSTGKAKRRSLLLTGCTFTGFSVVKHGIEDKATFAFQFTIYAPDSTELHNFVKDHFNADFFAAFEEGQMELASLETKSEDISKISRLAVEEADEDEDEDEDELSELRAAEDRIGVDEDEEPSHTVEHAFTA